MIQELMTQNASQKLKRNCKKICEEKNNDSNIFTTSALLVKKGHMNNKKWNNY